MAAVTKPTRLSFISAEKSESFIKKFNQVKTDESFKKSCKKAGKLFKTK